MGRENVRPHLGLILPVLAVLVSSCGSEKTTGPPVDHRQWTWETVAGGFAAWGVGGSSRDNVFFVGWGGSIGRFDGTSYRPQSSGTTAMLFDVWTCSPSCAVAVGDTGTILRYNGAAWRSEGGITRVRLRRVWGSGPDDVYAIGDQGTILHYSGGSWSVVRTWSPGSFDSYGGVWGSSGSDVYVVGSPKSLHYDGAAWSEMSFTGGAVWGTSAANVLVLSDSVRHYDGSRWTSIPYPRPLIGFSDVWGSSRDDIFIVGGSPQYGAAYVYHYDGVSWGQAYSGWYKAYEQVWGSSGNDVYVVGGGGEQNDSITHFNGTGWEELNARLYGVWGSSPADVFAVGSGVIRHYDGTSWRDASPPEGMWLLNGVWGSSSSDVFAVGDNGVCHYDGVAWRRMDAGTTTGLNGVWGSSRSDVFAVGGSGNVLHYDGAAWRDTSGANWGELRGVWGSSATDVFAVGGLVPGTIIHFDGRAWSKLNEMFDAALYAVWGSSGTDVFAVGDAFGNSRILHYNGSAWSTMLAGNPDQRSLRGVTGSSSSNVFAVSWPGSIQRYDGTQWKELRRDANPMIELDGVWCNSAGDEVYAVGRYGTIIHGVLR